MLLAAVFDGPQLKSHAAGPGQVLQGYIAWRGNGFAVSCPRGYGVPLWRADGQWDGFAPLQEACRLGNTARAGSRRPAVGRRPGGNLGTP